MAFNVIEKAAYQVVKDNVALKNAIKWVYQWIGATVSSSRLQTSLALTNRPQTFFGFHDKSPWSNDGRYLLGHRIQGDGTGQNWQQGKRVAIYLFTGEHWTEPSQLASTRAWNWQQGSQLQWTGFENEVVYNDFRGGTCRAVIQYPDHDSEHVLQYPVAAMAPDGQRYASICFRTFGRAMYGYGYAFEALHAESNVPPRTLLIVERGGENTRIQIEDLPDTFRQIDKGIDFFSHCIFAPDGERLLFLRRQAQPNKRLRSEMFCIDLPSGPIHRVGFKDMVSHFSWLGANAVLAYANTETGGDGFYRVDVETGAIKDWSERLNDRDGHPHATPDGSTLVFDTYPDRARKQQLFYWKEGMERAEQVAAIPSPMKFWGPVRVDLHPRVRADGRYVAFDTGFGGTRSLVTAELP
jgi:hypothetical protein